MEERLLTITRTAAFIALITAGGWISLPFFPVPLTLQTLFVLLAGAVMKKKGIVPVALYIALGTAGLPLFHNGAAGPGVLLGPTGGYMIGFIAAAYLVGAFYEKPGEKYHLTGLALGTAAIYACGYTWLVLSTGMNLWLALVTGVIPFIPGDAIKAYAAYLIEKRLR